MKSVIMMIWYLALLVFAKRVHAQELSASTLLNCPLASTLPNCSCNYRPMSQKATLSGCVVNSIQSFILKMLNNFTRNDFSMWQWPIDIFRKTTLKELDISKGDVRSIVTPNGESIFRDLATSLQVLKLADMNLTAFDWSHLNGLKALRYLRLKNIPLKNIAFNINGTCVGGGLLERVELKNNGLLKLQDDAFACLENLRHLEITDNILDSLKRSMFPQWPTGITVLYFSYNHLRQLPKDLFQGMTQLSNLDLRNNFLTTLSKEVFTPIWPKLKLFKIQGNPFHCDCKMIWLLYAMKEYEGESDYGVTECASPPNLKGHLLNSLHDKDLICG